MYYTVETTETQRVDSAWLQQYTLLILRYLQGITKTLTKNATKERFTEYLYIYQNSGEIAYSLLRNLSEHYLIA